VLRVDNNRKAILAWVPRDGDAILTKEGFVFYTFGYLHSPDRVTSYLKYVPKELAKEFSLEWLPYEWNLATVTLVRPVKLYSPANYEHIIKVLMSSRPEYVVDDPNLNKKLLGVPRKSVGAVFQPSLSLTRLLGKEKTGQLDQLESAAVKLIKSLSRQTGIPLKSFGVHGSISLGMHNPRSDIDISVYGADNFTMVLRHLNALSNKGAEFKFLEETVFDTLRRNRFIWDNKRVVVNATRSYEELREKFGDFTYVATGRHVSFMCEVTDARESVFRPAIYKVSQYEPLDRQSNVEDCMIPCEAVSMIGEFRGIASKGDKIKVSGSLEKVTVTETGELDHYRAVVGSGQQKPQDEFISVGSRF
jgi:predicted nucleotidyltransferase